MRKWFDQVVSMVKSPSKFFKKMKTKGGYHEPIRFSAMNFAIGGFLLGLLTLNILSIVIAPIVAVVFGVLSLFLSALIYHFILIILGGKGDYEATFRVIAYSSITVLLSWIPIVGPLVLIYSIYLYTVGFSKTHKLSTGKALLGALLPLVLIILVTAVIISLASAAFLGAYFSSLLS